MGWEGRGRAKREGTYVYLWLVPINVWQKPTQYCKAIILQLKINTFLKIHDGIWGLAAYLRGYVCSENGWREFELSSSSLLLCMHLLILEGAVLYLCIYSVNSLTASLGATYHCCANIQMRKVRWEKVG